MKRFLLPLLLAFALPAYSGQTKYGVEIDPMTDQKKITLMLLSEDKVDNSIGVPKFTALFVRCWGGEPEVFFMTPTYNGNNTRVGLRWDRDQSKYLSWNPSQAGDGYFSSNPIDTIQTLKGSSSLIFAWTPYKRTMETAKFSLNDLKPLIKKGQTDGCPY
tara:strand:- start:1156 stop:1635 length:480 start_codon:yes stop_codon:yes gene_type:complete